MTLPETLAVPHLREWDYVILALVMLASSSIGLYFACTSGKQKTTKEFFVADGSMGTLPTALSLLGSSVNAIMILGTTSEIYFHDTIFLYLVLNYFITIPVTIYIYVPLYHELGVISAYEYLERRFDKTIRRIASICFMMQSIMFAAVVLYTPALALSQVTGFDLWTSILTLGIICIFYSTIGGIKAVIWSDVLQISLMFGCIVAIVVIGGYNVGGFRSVWQKGWEGNRIRFSEFRPSLLIRHSFWSLFIGGSFSWVSMFCCNQAMVQRYLATPSIETSRRALWWNLPCLVTFLLFSVCGGLIVYAFYRDCDPLVTKRIQKPDQLLPLFVMDMFSYLPGFAGFFVAGCFSGALSTISSSINSLSAITLIDWVKPYWSNMSEKKCVILSKAFTVSYGILIISLIALIQAIESIIMMSYVFVGILGGPIIGLFTLGMFFPRASARGALCGFLGSLAIASWIAFGTLANFSPVKIREIDQSFIEGCDWMNGSLLNETSFNVQATTPESLLFNQTADFTSMNATSLTPKYTFPLYRISYLWYGAISCLSVVIIGVVLSFFPWTGRSSDIEESLLTPLARTTIRWMNKHIWKKEYTPVPVKLKTFSLKEINNDGKSQTLIMTEKDLNENGKDYIGT